MNLPTALLVVLHTTATRQAGQQAQGEADLWNTSSSSCIWVKLHIVHQDTGPHGRTMLVLDAIGGVATCKITPIPRDVYELKLAIKQQAFPNLLAKFDAPMLSVYPPNTHVPVCDDHNKNHNKKHTNNSHSRQGGTQSLLQSSSVPPTDTTENEPLVVVATMVASTCNRQQQQQQQQGNFTTSTTTTSCASPASTTASTISNFVE
eukprot:CAMPEP_0118699020 /NCGR_PEP_ID=MMETSP0800-20121206/15602_1 /TAXON_ID=210618 ORGANISM="Striatella unipunctata, Strain CCMP2910" /NCGR_SAMPLE_ID=MMETSP0800 /ASSEMBLY_ACC=CAM_ASM_000638 /LENGTH=204 /DNA_ID=CAMNT_0006599061 /DNA_START=45 /DNA_END=659 /DNA_ORIENTATION=+